MAKTRSKKANAEPKPAGQTRSAEPIAPKTVHELLGVYGPYEPPPPPVPTKGYAVFWDPGCSIQTLVAKKRELFYLPKTFESERFARDTDQWKWRMMRLQPVEPGLTFAEQEEKLATGDKPAAARELVTFLVLHFLMTGEKLEMCRWRCADTVDSGRRVIVGPFWAGGIEIANVSDRWKSPGIALSALCTPAVPIKKRK